MLELDASIGAGQAPVYGAFGGVALSFPGPHFSGESFPVGDAPIQTLASQHAQLYLGHVQPRAVLWGVVDLQLLAWAAGFGRSKRLILQGGRSVGVEVIHHQNDSLGVGVVVEVNQLSYAMRPLDLRPPLGDADVAPAGQGLTDDEEVRRPIALVLVLVVVAGGSSPEEAPSGSSTPRPRAACSSRPDTPAGNARRRGGCRPPQERPPCARRTRRLALEENGPLPA
jgi:hypothetical protein